MSVKADKTNGAVTHWWQACSKIENDLAENGGSHTCTMPLSVQSMITYCCTCAQKPQTRNDSLGMGSVSAAMTR